MFSMKEISSIDFTSKEFVYFSFMLLSDFWGMLQRLVDGEITDHKGEKELTFFTAVFLKL